MITVQKTKLPVGLSAVYLYDSGVLLGPWLPDGSLPTMEKMSERLPEDYLQQGNTLYGENSVSHSKTEGNIIVPSTAVYRTSSNNPGYIETYRYRRWWQDYSLFRPSAFCRPGNSGHYSSTFFKREGGGYSQMFISWSHSMFTDKARPSEVTIQSASFKGVNDPDAPSVGTWHYTRKTYKPRQGNKVLEQDLTFDWDTMWEYLQQWELYLSDQDDYPDLTASPIYVDVVESSDKTSLARIHRTVRGILLDQKNYSDRPDTDGFGVLVGEAAASVDANKTNMIAFLRDLKDVKSLVPKLKNLTQLKSHAGNYLAVNYGILPTVSDLDAIRQSFSHHVQTDRNGLSTYHSGRTYNNSEDGKAPCVVVERLKLGVGDYDSRLSEMVGKLRTIGLYPSPQNLWDLVPYSFVIDWFVDIGSILESVDNATRVAQLPIKYCTTSTKTIYDFTRYVSAMGFSGTLTSTMYTRSVSPKAPRPTLNFEAGVTAQDHLIEGTALILQRTK